MVVQTEMKMNDSRGKDEFIRECKLGQICLSANFSSPFKRDCLRQSSVSNLDQLPQGLHVRVYQVVGASGNVSDSIGTRIHSETVVESGKYLLEFHWSIDYFPALLVGAADHLTVAHATSCKQCEGCLRPMVATVVLI